MATMLVPARNPWADRTASPPPRGAAAQDRVDRRGTARRLVILAILYALPAVVVMRGVSDNDIWMNLRAGQWIIDHGAVPETDPFSSYGQGRAWVAYAWLFDVLVRGLHRWLGLTGILLYRVVLSYAVLAALHRFVIKRERRFALATSLAGLAFFALLGLLSERTWLFTILFTTLTLDVILDLREGRRTRAVWLLPLVYALWANVHIQFAYGLFLLGLACVAPWIDRCLGRAQRAGHASAAGSRDWWKLAALTGACLGATLVNPYHVRLYGVIAGYAGQSESFNLVSELLAPAFRSPMDWAVLALAGGAAFALGRRRDLSAFEVLLLIATAVLAFRARRDVWFVVLAALAILSTSRLLPGRATDSFALTGSRLSVVAGAVLAVLVTTGWARGLSERGLEEEVAATYPADSAAYVADHGYQGPLYNDYGWGSYLIWRLPALPVVIDGRAELHGPERMQRFKDTGAGKPGWEADPDLSTAATVITGARDTLTSLLRLDPRFELVHEDPVAVVFVARRLPGEAARTTPGAVSSCCGAESRPGSPVRTSRGAVVENDSHAISTISPPRGP